MKLDAGDFALQIKEPHVLFTPGYKMLALPCFIAPPAGSGRTSRRAEDSGTSPTLAM